MFAQTIIYNKNIIQPNLMKSWFKTKFVDLEKFFLTIVGNQEIVWQPNLGKLFRRKNSGAFNNDILKKICFKPTILRKQKLENEYCEIND